jgi:hypothetical protein
MTPDEQRALEALRFNWTWTSDDVWEDSPFHVEGMHVEVDREVLAGLRDAKASKRGSPIGLVVRGQRGSGKTHLLGWVRRQAQQEGGYFFFVDLDQTAEFWSGILHAVQRDLLLTNGTGQTQLTVLLRRLATKAACLMNTRPLTRARSVHPKRTSTTSSPRCARSTLRCQHVERRCEHWSSTDRPTKT